jgi:hypothetical protein
MSLIDTLPPVIANMERKDPPKPAEPPVKFDIELDAPVDEDRQFVIICSRDLSDEDLQVFTQHGKTLRWKKESFFNLPFSQLDFDFLIIDAREKEARLTLNRQDLTKYNLVGYCYAIQKGIDDWLSELDTVDISSIPKFAINQKDFRHQLVTQKITAPSVAKSFLRYAVKCLFG